MCRDKPELYFCRRSEVPAILIFSFFLKLFLFFYLVVVLDFRRTLLAVLVCRSLKSAGIEDNAGRTIVILTVISKPDWRNHFFRRSQPIIKL